jgi:hypothetical protein
MSDIPEFHIVLDTNALFTEADAQLLTWDMRELIRRFSEEKKIKLCWHIPTIVKLLLERGKQDPEIIGERWQGHQARSYKQYR